MTRTLYATDLDGTLLGTDARLSAQTAAMCRSLLDNGTLLTFVTARTPATIEPILAPMRPALPGVAMTGASIWNPPLRRYDYVSYLRPSDVAAIASVCKERGVDPFVYTLPRGTNSIVVYHASERLTELEDKFVRERELNDLKRFCIGEPAPAEAANDTVLFFAIGDPAQIRDTANAIALVTCCYASWYPDTYNPGVALLEVFAGGVSKAAGLARLRGLLGADCVVAFGDNLNDIPLLQAADVAVAVENAHKDVLAIADVVIGPNTEDSVSLWIAEREGLI